MVIPLLRDLWARIRPADLADILVVAGLVYAAIRWFKTARSRFVIAGLGALAVLYGMARLLRMQLTLYLFHVGLTVALVAAVVIFQEEIRRAFERIGSSRLLRAARGDAGSRRLIEILVPSVAAMAAHRTGALIVLRGKEPLERHVTGGVELHGAPSEPLLLSLFDSKTPGHDGAVLIEGTTITRFAAHLPLSTQLKDNARHGTRHSAALGLSERSDALVIAVSEERGTISVARGGVLDVLASPAELEQRVLAFSTEITPQQHVPWQKRLFARNLREKALSLAIALGAWLAVFGYEGDTIARSYTVPVLYRDLPENWLLEEPRPPEVRVTIAASSGAFELLEPDELTIELGLGELRVGSQVVVLNDRALRLPAGFTVHRIDPRQVAIVAYRAERVRVPIRVTTRGQLRRGLRLVKLAAVPERVELLVRAGERERPSFVATEPIDLGAIEHSSSERRSLVPPQGARLLPGAPDEVEIRVELAGP
jgi:diadenylate cyclase